MPGTARSGTRHPFIWPALIPLLLLSYWLQTYGLAALRMSSDSSASVYWAHQTLLQIATTRAYDGHPPLYYYLLHFWELAGGNGELSVRLLSISFGMAGIAAAYALGRLAGGSRLGLAAAVLVAFSPELVYYDRLIRMYAGLACLSLISSYVFLRLLSRPSRRLLAVYVAVTLAAVFNHYYAVLLAATQALWWGWRCLRQKASWHQWSAVYLAIAVPYLPWLAYAGYTQVRTTAKIISIAPPASGALGFLQQLWVPLNLGVSLDMGKATLLSLPIAALLLAGLGALWRTGRFWPERLRALTFCTVTTVALSYVLFLVYPAAVRARHLLVILPLFLVLLAALTLNLARVSAPAWPAALALVLGLNSYGIWDTYQVQPHMEEADVVQLTQRLEQLAQPGDLVVFHAFWEIGYFQSHYRGPSVSERELSDVTSASITSYRRVWLSMYGVRPHDPRYPIEEWLDRSWAKLGQWQLGPNRLQLYAQPPHAGDNDAIEANVGGQVGVRASGAALTVSPGGSLVTTARFQALRPLPNRLTIFLHLTDARGNRIAGRDAEPQDGLDPTTDWTTGRPVEEPLGLLVPPDTPPGNYTLEMGMYRTGEAIVPLPVNGPRGPGGNLALARVRVQPLQPAAIRPRHRVEATFDGGPRLVGYDLDLDGYTVESERVIHASMGEDIVLPRRRTAYHPGETIDLTLYWLEQDGSRDLTLFAHVLDATGSLKAQHDQSLGPTGPPGSVAVIHDAIALPNDLASGSYALRVGLYRQPSLQRLNISGSARDYVELQRITVTG